MQALALKILPLLIAFIAGFAAHQTGLLGKPHADRMLRFVVYIGLPILIVMSISQIQLTTSLSLLPVSAVIIIVCTWPLATLTGRLLGLPKARQGAFVISPMIMNLSLVYPFVIVLWGAEGFAYLALFDFGNGLLVFTLVYALSCWYGADQSHWLVTLRRLLRFPPFIALFAALALNFAQLRFPPGLVDGMQWAGRIILLLVPLAMGIYLDTRQLISKATLSVVLLRAGLGLLIALLLVEVFALEGLMRTIVLVGSVAPVGFNVLVFAAQHHLDKEFAASLASASLILALIYLPVMVYLI